MNKDDYEEEDKHLIALYQKFGVRVVRGEGALLYDSSGKEYIDLSGGYGVAIVGHGNKKVAKAVADQAARLITCHGSLYNDAREGYLEAISAHLPGGLTRLFLCSSGAEANEAAIKFARKATGRKRVLAFTGSYHGKTLGALSATWSQKYRKQEFAPFVDGFDFAPFGNLERASESLQKDETAAIIVEPIQGESGIHVPPDNFLLGLRRLADATGALLVFDEVQSGFGRTGRMWACQNWNVAPDIMTAAKGIAGGVPFGFCAVTEKVSQSLKVGEHTSTFGGNPLACAAGKAALEFLLEEGLIEKGRARGEYFRAKLKTLRARHPSILREVRGRGLMLAAELRIPVKDVVVSGYDAGLVLLYSGLNVLRLLPPLVISEEQIDASIEKLDRIFGSMDRGREKLADQQGNAVFDSALIGGRRS
jgi:acetylornithine/LysW-gamma-L-lysine aminotransferase